MLFKDDYIHRGVMNKAKDLLNKCRAVIIRERGIIE